MPEEHGSATEQVLYQCPRCLVQWTGPDVDELRLCECSSMYGMDDKHLEAIGTAQVDGEGWTQLESAAEQLQKGFGVLYDSDRMKRDGPYTDWDTEDDPVPGEIHGVEETRYGPRYEVCPDTEWWRHEEGVKQPVPEDHVWHWEIVKVTERTRASARLADLRENRGEAGD